MRKGTEKQVTYCCNKMETPVNFISPYTHHFSHVRLFVTLWTASHHAPLSMGFTRQHYWSGLPHPSPGDLLDPEIKAVPLMSLHWHTGSLLLVPPGKPCFSPMSWFSTIMTDTRRCLVLLSGLHLLKFKIKGFSDLPFS